MQLSNSFSMSVIQLLGCITRQCICLKLILFYYLSNSLIMFLRFFLFFLKSSFSCKPEICWLLLLCQDCIFFLLRQLLFVGTVDRVKIFQFNFDLINVIFLNYLFIYNYHYKCDEYCFSKVKLCMDYSWSHSNEVIDMFSNGLVGGNKYVTHDGIFSVCSLHLFTL